MEVRLPYLLCFTFLYGSKPKTQRPVSSERKTQDARYSRKYIATSVWFVKRKELIKSNSKPSGKHTVNSKPSGNIPFIHSTYRRLSGIITVITLLVHIFYIAPKNNNKTISILYILLTFLILILLTLAKSDEHYYKFFFIYVKIGILMF